MTPAIAWLLAAPYLTTLVIVLVVVVGRVRVDVQIGTGGPAPDPDHADGVPVPSGPRRPPLPLPARVLPARERTQPSHGGPRFGRRPAAEVTPPAFALPPDPSDDPATPGTEGPHD